MAPFQLRAVELLGCNQLILATILSLPKNTHSASMIANHLSKPKKSITNSQTTCFSSLKLVFIHHHNLSIIHPSSPCVCLVKQKGPRDVGKLLVNPLHPRWHTLNQHLSRKGRVRWAANKNSVWHSIESWLFNIGIPIIFMIIPTYLGSLSSPIYPKEPGFLFIAQGMFQTFLEGWWRCMIVKQISTTHPPQLLGESYCWKKTSCKSWNVRHMNIFLCVYVLSSWNRCKNLRHFISTTEAKFQNHQMVVRRICGSKRMPSYGMLCCRWHRSYQHVAVALVTNPWQHRAVGRAKWRCEDVWSASPCVLSILQWI